MSGGGGGGNTVTQVQQLPQFEQDFAQSNQSLAASLGSQPYPVYQAPLIQSFTPQQTRSFDMAGNAATAYQPAVDAATGAAANTVAAGAPLLSQGASLLNGAAGGDPGVIGHLMSPYVSAALAPQITALETQIGQQHAANAAGATGAGAFGDARQGSYDALTDFYGNQNLTGLLGQGYNTAYSNALQTALGVGNTEVNAGMTAGLQGGQLLGNLGGLNQSLGITGANALYGVGQVQQQQGQQELNAAYQQYLNQTNWPFQMLNVRESALSNSPYNIATATTLPNANMTAQGIGTAANISGLIGSLLSGSGGNAPFGGTTIH